MKFKSSLKYILFVNMNVFGKNIKRCIGMKSNFRIIQKKQLLSKETRDWIGKGTLGAPNISEISYFFKKI